MDFHQFATSGFGTRLWAHLGHYVPLRSGRLLARVAASALGRRHESAIYHTIFANQTVIHGPDASPEQVDQAVQAVLQHGGMASYDLMHLVGLGERAVTASVDFDPGVWADLEAARSGGHGVMACAAHLSNFNLAFVAFALSGIPLQSLSAPLKGGGFALINRLRTRGMLEDTPINAGALRKAIGRLRSGGTVITGIDWPLPTLEHARLPFFGRPAHLPTGHVRLALLANARLLPVGVGWKAGRGYYVETRPPLELEYTGDRDDDILHNARRILAVMENWIRQRPEQWLMYHPVWD